MPYKRQQLDHRETSDSEEGDDVPRITYSVSEDVRQENTETEDLTPTELLKHLRQLDKKNLPNIHLSNTQKDELKAYCQENNISILFREINTAAPHLMIDIDQGFVFASLKNWFVYSIDRSVDIMTVEYKLDSKRQKKYDYTSPCIGHTILYQNGKSAAVLDHYKFFHTLFCAIYFAQETMKPRSSSNKPSSTADRKAGLAQLLQPLSRDPLCHTLYHIMLENPFSLSIIGPEECLPNKPSEQLTKLLEKIRPNPLLTKLASASPSRAVEILREIQESTPEILSLTRFNIVQKNAIELHCSANSIGILFEELGNDLRHPQWKVKHIAQAAKTMKTDHNLDDNQAAQAAAQESGSKTKDILSSLQNDKYRKELSNLSKKLNSAVEITEPSTHQETLNPLPRQVPQRHDEDEVCATSLPTRLHDDDHHQPHEDTLARSTGKPPMRSSMLNAHYNKKLQPFSQTSIARAATSNGKKHGYESESLPSHPPTCPAR